MAHPLLAAALQVSYVTRGGCVAPASLERAARGAPGSVFAAAASVSTGSPGASRVTLKPEKETWAAADSTEHWELCIPLAASSKMSRGILFRVPFPLDFPKIYTKQQMESGFQNAGLTWAPPLSLEKRF